MSSNSKGDTRRPVPLTEFNPLPLSLRPSVEKVGPKVGGAQSERLQSTKQIKLKDSVHRMKFSQG